MAKWKRGREAPISGVRRQRISQKLHYTTNRVAHAFKVAKGFERLKLGKRQKKAREEGKEADEERVDSEIAALKALDLKLTARLYYLKFLHKNKDISTSTYFAGLIDLPELPIEGATQNVVARLCNNQSIKKAFQDGHDDVLQAAGIPLPKLARKDTGRMQRMRDRETETDKVFSADEDDRDDSTTAPPVRAPTIMSKGDDETLGWAIDEVGAESFVATDKPTLPVGSKRKRDDPPSSAHPLENDVSDSEAGRESEIETEPAPSKKQKKKEKKQQQDTRPTSSIILPSLTSGFISGSEDSDIEDINEPPRKNRPGQRARQAAWEKKYGTKAKHLQNASRDQGWDAKRGATSSTAGRNFKPRDRPLPERMPHALVVAKPKRDDSGPLHPSWEAAKLAKAKSAAMPAFEGKKIAFD